MYNIIKHLEDVFKNLERQGFTYQIPRKMLIAEIKRSTSVFNEKTLAHWLKSFVEMGYLRTVSPLVFERCLDFNNPYVFHDGKDFNGADDVDIKGEKKQ